MTLYEIIVARKAIIEAVQDKTTSFNTMYAIAKFLKDTAANEEFWTDGIKKIYSEYGVTETGVPAEKLDEVNTRINELQKVEVEKPKMDLTVEQLQCVDSINLQQVLAIMPFIAE